MLNKQKNNHYLNIREQEFLFSPRKDRKQSGQRMR